MKKNSFLQLLESFLNDYLPFTKGLSQNTIKSYKYAFILLIEFFDKKLDVKSDHISFALLNTENITLFLKWLEDERKCSPSTRNQRLAALDSFSIFAQNKDFDAAACFRSALLKVPRKKTSKKIRSHFSKEEIKILLSLPNEKNEIGLRDKVLLSFMYATGTRAQEVCDVKVKDISFNNELASIKIFGKGNKGREIAIPSKISKILKDYLIHKNIANSPESHVFSSITHEKMTISCIEEIFKKYVSLAKDKHKNYFKEATYTPHSMRHTTACHMINMGIPLIVIKNYLGHSSIQTTEIYIELSQNEVNEKLKDWNEKWFVKENKINNKKENIPSFLRM